MTDSPTPTPEPLSPTTLAELYARDPLTLTRDAPEIAQIVDQLRAQRANFNAAESRGERPKAAKRPAKEKVDLSQLAIDI